MPSKDYVLELSHQYFLTKSQSSHPSNLVPSRGEVLTVNSVYWYLFPTNHQYFPSTDHLDVPLDQEKWLTEYHLHPV
ncbi:hypothetical protein NVV78_06510 [Pediococcus ethanolidurans]|uniref:hypothetical protein n=1 Tax=Pediococcus ethanolidurans TaxID=319653 RepID=UPI0021E6DD3B|nr:hypothetical protein [Pediococcus ethanolidurans]